MAGRRRKSLAEYLKLEYPFQLVADPDGGWVVVFPDLPGCLTQVDSLDEIPHMVTEAMELWIETAYEQGIDIPLPSYPDEYSGKFNLRLPKSLHRELAEGAERDGVSLNQHVLALLSRRDFEATVERRLDDIERSARKLMPAPAARTHVADERAPYDAAPRGSTKRSSSSSAVRRVSATKPHPAPRKATQR